MIFHDFGVPWEFYLPTLKLKAFSMKSFLCERCDLTKSVLNKIKGTVTNMVLASSGNQMTQNDMVKLAQTKRENCSCK